MISSHAEIAWNFERARAARLTLFAECMAGTRNGALQIAENTIAEKIIFGRRQTLQNKASAI